MSGAIFSLFLRERECPVWFLPLPAGEGMSGAVFSLSLRERAGVRASDDTVAQQHCDTPPFNPFAYAPS